MNVLLIDTSSREVMISGADATEVPKLGLVIRFGAAVGSIKRITGKVHLQPDMPVVITTQGCSAKQNSGYVKVLMAPQGNGRAVRKIIGADGMPWPHQDRLLKPFYAAVLPPGTKIRAVKTQNRGKTRGDRPSSNPGAAAAALAALKTRVTLEPRLVLLAEGEKGFTRAWEFIPPAEAKVPRFPREDTAGDFSNAALAEAALRPYAAPRPLFLLALGQVAASLHTDPTMAGQTQYLRDLAQLPEWQWTVLLSGAEDALAARCEAGWSFRHIPGDTWTVEITPPGGRPAELAIAADSTGYNEYLIHRLIDMSEKSRDPREQYHALARTHALRGQLLDFAQQEPVTGSITLFPASGVSCAPAEEWSFEPVPGVSPVEAASAVELLQLPAFAELAQTKNLLLVQHDAEGRAVKARHLEHSTRRWQKRELPRAALNILSVAAAPA